MASTKIINVLKDDTFDEIIKIFRSSAAEEVIFVLPKKSKAFSKEAHFESLKQVAGDEGKVVSFLCSNPDINTTAKQYGFEVLLSRPSTSSKKKTKSATVNVVNQIEDFYQPEDTPVTDAAFEAIHQKEDSIVEPERPEEPPREQEEQSEDEVTDEEPEATGMLAAQRMDEIVPTANNGHRPVKVSMGRPKKFSVDVRRDVPEMDIDKEVADMWQRQPDAESVSTPIGKKSRWKFFSRTKTTPRVITAAQPRASRRRSRLWVVGATSLIVIAGTVLLVFTGKAQVTITPVANPIDMTLTITAADTVGSVDPVNFKIPGQTFTISKSVSQTFPATGERDVAQKAQGQITVQNNLPAAQPLVATTRLESSDGHIFHTLASITVPAANGSTPGSIAVQVIADKAGADYNVPAGSFTVPAFQENGDTNRYQNITGTSSAAMHGGTSGQATIVTQDDLTQAQTTLTTQATTAVTDAIQSEVNGLEVVNQSQIAVTQTDASAQVDDAADNFTLTMTGTLKTVAFQQSDLNSLLSQYIATKYQYHFEPSKATITFSNANYDPTSGTLIATVSVKGQAYDQVDTAQIISGLLGKKADDIKAYLSSAPGVASANVSLSPIWVRSIPTASNRVNVQLAY